jgi:hypothetical protein
MNGVTTIYTDERTITIPIPAGPADTAKISEAVSEAQAAGYTIKAAQTLEQGQRDPIPYAFRIVMQRGA